MYCVFPTHGNQYWYLDAHCSWYMITTKGKGSPIVHVMSTPVIYEWTKSLLNYTPVDSLGSCNDLSHQMISNIGTYWHPSRHHVHLSPGYKCLGVQLRDVSKYLPGKRSICEATTLYLGLPLCLVHPNWVTWAKLTCVSTIWSCWPSNNRMAQHINILGMVY